MFFLYTPQDPSPVYYDPEEAFLEYQRREYVKRLQEEQQRAQFERELELERERHRVALEHIAQKERQRRQGLARLQAEEVQTRAEAANRYARQQQQQHQQQQYSRYHPSYAQTQASPSPREILARRLARQEEEERRSRQFHQNILSHIFGVPIEELDQSMDEGDENEQEEEQAEEIPEQPTLAQLLNATRRRHSHLPEPPLPVRKPSLMQPVEPVQAPVLTPTESSSVPASAPIPETTAESAPQETIMETDEPLPEAESEPHWSTAPERARSLAQISGIDRAFNSLKSTFVFPSGPLDRLPGSDAPRLAYNSTNASIHAYEHALSELLSKLDGIESYGFKGIREARKQLVVRIEKELEELEKTIAQRLTEGVTPVGAAATVSVPIEAPATPMEVEADEAAKEKATTTTTSTDAHPVAPVEASTIQTSVSQPVRSASTALASPLPAEPVEAMTAPTPVMVDAPKTSTPLPPSSLPSETVDAVTVPSKDSSVPTPATHSGEEAPKLDTTTASTSTEAEKAPSNMTSALAISLPESPSDEELEVDDAIHIGITDDEADASHNVKSEHNSAVGAFEML